MLVVGTALGLAQLSPKTNSHGPRPSPAAGNANDDVRRSILKKSTAGIPLFLGLNIFSRDALAFDNRVNNNYMDRPKSRGPKPADLGVAPRKDIDGEKYAGLKNCGNAPNCFCSTDGIREDPAHNVPAWNWPASMEKKDAFVQLIGEVNAYRPGQGGIDGGGFKVVAADADKGYVYAQFESLKAGYVDDLEFAFVESSGKDSVQLRSSSRVGYLDYGVNAKRINFLAEAMRAKGWEAPGVDLDTHVNYAVLNSLV